MSAILDKYTFRRDMVIQYGKMVCLQTYAAISTSVDLCLLMMPARRAPWMGKRDLTSIWELTCSSREMEIFIQARVNASVWCGGLVTTPNDYFDFQSLSLSKRRLVLALYWYYMIKASMGWPSVRIIWDIISPRVKQKLLRGILSRWPWYAVKSIASRKAWKSLNTRSVSHAGRDNCRFAYVETKLTNQIDWNLY